MTQYSKIFDEESQQDMIAPTDKEQALNLQIKALQDQVTLLSTSIKKERKPDAKKECKSLFEVSNKKF